MYQEQKIEKIKKLLKVSQEIEGIFKKDDVTYEGSLRIEIMNKIESRMIEIIKEMGLSAEG